MSQIYYADTSALVKRHLDETGSRWFQELVRANESGTIMSSKLSIVELFSAFNRRRREATISEINYSDFTRDFSTASGEEYDLIDLSDSIIIIARRMLEAYSLRTGDSVQLASAIHVREILLDSQLQAPIFLASDNKLLDAAIAEGFTTDNPLLHP